MPYPALKLSPRISRTGDSDAAAGNEKKPTMDNRSDKITFMNTSKPEPKTEPKTFALKASNLSKIVASPEGMLTILDQVSLQVSHGERIAIIGASGAGKSTLLGLLAGLDLPTSGKVWLGDQELTALDEDGRAALRANEVGFVFQSFHLLSLIHI